MKLSYLKLALPLLFIFCLTTKAQSSLDSTFVYTMCTGPTHDTATVYYQSYINPLLPNTTVTIYHGDGTSNVLSSFNGQNVNYAHVYATKGTYTVKLLLKVNGAAVDSEIKTIDANCYPYCVINVYDDVNKNCSADSGEYYPGLYQARYEIRENGVIKDTVTVRGLDFLKARNNKNYTVTFLNPPLNTTGICPASGSITQFISTPFTPYYFGIQSATTTQYDLETFFYGRFRPTNFSYLVINAGQIANNQLINGTLTLNLDPKYTYQSATLTPSGISGNTLTWNLTYLNWLAYNQIWVTVTPATTVTIGDTVCNTVSLTPTSGDINTANNTFTSCNKVVSSFDPNYKTVSPEGDVNVGDKLTYRIYFENTGDDTAFNIHIMDTLSANLDISTFEITNSSHHLSMYDIAPLNNQNIVNFSFKNIKLPDTSSRPYNQGFVEYTIRTIYSLPMGTHPVYNAAGIYFDSNPAVMTNTVTNNIIVWEGIDEAAYNSSSIYPNPVHDVLTVKSAATLSQVRIINAMGQTMTETTINAKEARIDVKQLPAGVYYLILNGNDGVKTEKIIKE